MARPFTTKLTDRQQEVLDWVRRFAEQHKMPPTVREIGRAFKITPRAVSDFLEALERKGYLKRGNLGARSIEFSDLKALLPRDLRIVGQIAAGKPIYAHEDDLGTLSLEPLIEKGCFALIAEGDSMIEAGILDGDYVIVHPQDHARDGDMVVALINDEEATVKYLYHETDRIRLQPANSNMEPIYIKPEELRIQGRVVAMQRNYESLRGGSHV